MVHFRKRLGKNIINEVNELIAKEAVKPDKDDDNNNQSGGAKPTKNTRRLID
jgi:hypothetical protein